MKNLAGRVLLMLLVLSLAGCSQAKPQLFKSGVGKFSVMTPLELKESTRPVATQGGNVDLHMFLGDAGSVSYMVAFADYPPELLNADPQIILEGSRDGIVKNINGAITGDVEIDISGNPGREFVMDGNVSNQDVTAKARIALVASRLYEVMVLSAKGSANMAEVNSFLTSFILLP